MKQTLKRLFLLIFIFCFLFSSACSVPNKSTSETGDIPKTNISDQTVESSTQDEKNDLIDSLSSLPKTNFKDREFRIATDNSTLFITSNNTSVVGKKKYLRNVAIEETYHVKITLTEESGLPSITERIKTEALAGTDFCDLVVLDLLPFSQLVSNDLLVNVRAVPYLDLDQEGLQQTSLSATTFGSYTYGFAADFLYQPENSFCVFFNKTLLSQTALPSLYDLVNENQWDFENFLLYAEEVYSVSRAAGNKISGFCSTESREKLINILWAAGGQRFLANDYGTRPYLNFDNETTQSFIQSLQKMLFRSIAYNGDSSVATHQFAAGSAFFLIAPLSAAQDISGNNVNFGVVPLPKQDINQAQFYSYLDSSNYAGFLKSTRDLNFSGMVTNALVKASASLPQELALTSYLNLYFNSQDDYKMMGKIISSPYYETVDFFKQMDASITASTQTVLFRTISSEGRFNTLYTQYTKMFEKFLNTKF